MAERSQGDVDNRIPGHYGAPVTGVRLRELAIGTAWNVQGDAANPGFAAAAENLFGAALPTVPNWSNHARDWTALWTGPQSWLLIAGPSLATPTLDSFVGCRDRLNAVGGALFDLSASRVGFALSGAAAATVLTRTCPLDLHPRVFPAGTCAQSVAGHIGVLLYKTDDAPTFVVMVARSMAVDAWSLLCACAAECGFDVVPAGVFGGAFPA